MRFLVSIAQEHIAPDEQELWAPAGEPVVPWYPAVLFNGFVSTISFKRAQYAKVVELAEFDPDAVVASLVKYYPGLPRNLHENYVFRTGQVANMFPLNTKFRIFITQDSANLMVCDDNTTFTTSCPRSYYMWTRQPI